jgi:hypothetical protein
MSLRTDWDYDYGDVLETPGGFRGEVVQRQEWMQRNGNTRTRYCIKSADGRAMWFRFSALRSVAGALKSEGSASLTGTMAKLVHPRNSEISPPVPLQACSYPDY